ncbi:thiamine pyrophosphate-binding protein [Bordetella hinzii]|uniref:Thiamine pyrophosphate-binding protein n=1 Tax=Bordetella hinzii TaxID=103855 RepID=A0AAN1VE40_9BORD|nr:thiamine pyrophosphate-binding protein [Bordetella hinzii]AKQ59395.1 Acetolactate synthase isozyme 2 large subunit [Bordetella hinzii]AZW15371.1 thiamine pyrophosphate-binding protein [Bordetella hinzii]KCB48083.1 thiamine pyrophosphate enzyme, N-terminal TPP binding domain protein [Bordetella hinzii 4161]KXA72025.1 thiamine pyrophosphate-binding protein [Bordetella hinzii LMG 13501]MBZ0073907.1 thiamine pyrophosphate-binding protein [Bordetella hinzii]
MNTHSSATPSSASPRLGGHILVDQLAAHGVKHVFCVPGESYLAVLDGLHDASIEVTVCRQEGGAAMMADAHGKLTGEPGICMVTRGPGASNALAGVHIAKQDSTPLILFVGQIERGMREREAFQEMDYRAVFGTQAKWVTEIDQVERIPELISRAFHIATSGRPGPVVIALPEDMLVETADVPDAPHYEVIDAAPAAGQMETLAQMLAQARKPVAILGGTRWDAEAVARFADFARAHALPVAVSFRRQMLFPADHPCYIGDVGLGINPALLARVRDADLILLVGGRMSESPSQAYTLLDIPVPRQKLVHVHPDSAELARVYRPNLAVNVSPAAFSAALAGLPAPKAAPAWAADTEAMRQSYLAWSDPAKVRTPGKLQMGEVMAYLEAKLPADAIMTNGAGNYATWLHRFHRYTRYGTQLAPTSGSMGYGLPAAVGAKRIWPDKTVVCFAGDGCFLMHGQEFATAVQYDLPIIVVLVDNGMYGTIRMHQEKHYPGRISATQLKNPDFADYARAFGGHGERVETSAEFGPAFERALASGKPAILHCLIDPETISPSTTLEKIRAAALAAKA